MYKILCFILFILTFYCCDVKKFCGEPIGKEKEFIDSLNTVYSNQLTVEQVPCYPGYLKATLYYDISDSIIESIDKIVKKRYVEFLVYNKKGKLVKGDTGSM